MNEQAEYDECVSNELPREAKLSFRDENRVRNPHETFAEGTRILLSSMWRASSKQRHARIENIKEPFDSASRLVKGPFQSKDTRTEGPVDLMCNRAEAWIRHCDSLCGQLCNAGTRCILTSRRRRVAESWTRRRRVAEKTSTPLKRRRCSKSRTSREPATRKIRSTKNFFTRDRHGFFVVASVTARRNSAELECFRRRTIAYDCRADRSTLVSARAV